MTDKLYADRRPWELEPQYSQHVSAMTAEKLHDKSAIAAELARRLGEATKENAALRDKFATLREVHAGCDTSECLICGTLDCPDSEPLHYDKDGCPAEYVAEMQRRAEASPPPPAPSGFVPGARVRVRTNALVVRKRWLGLSGTIISMRDPAEADVLLDGEPEAIPFLTAFLDLLPATPAAPVREEPAISPADAEELRAWRSLRRCIAHPNTTPAALCRALGLEGWT